MAWKSLVNQGEVVTVRNQQVIVDEDGYVQGTTDKKRLLRETTDAMGANPTFRHIPDDPSQPADETEAGPTAAEQAGSERKSRRRSERRRSPTGASRSRSSPGSRSPSSSSSSGSSSSGPTQTE